jgi:hypothetical protein
MTRLIFPVQMMKEQLQHRRLNLSSIYKLGFRSDHSLLLKRTGSTN